MIIRIPIKRTNEDFKRIDLIVCPMEQYIKIHRCSVEQYEKAINDVPFEEAYELIVDALEALSEIPDNVERKNRVANYYISRLKFWIYFKWNSAALMLNGSTPNV